jgi:preprotein translocase subunit YajC
MELLIFFAVPIALVWLLVVRPQQRRVRAHQALVDAVQVGDDVILSAGIFGRIVELSPDEMTLTIARGVEIRVARQAVLRRVEDARPREGDGVSAIGDSSPDSPADTSTDALSTGPGAGSTTDDLSPEGGAPSTVDDLWPGTGPGSTTDEPTDR